MIKHIYLFGTISGEIIKKNICTALIFILGIFTALSAVSETLSGRVSVIDGDTFEMHGERIRLHGIDAPESGQSCKDVNGKTYRCGQMAAKQMFSYVSGKTVNCEVIDKDRYGRVIASCFVDGADINELLVKDGWALAYRQYSSDYASTEDQAKRENIGLWQGEFVEPWNWRRGERLEDVKVQKDSNCLIKGNISSSGKIYHLPSSPWYTRTKINTSKGERWFCTKEEAEAAGWRAPR